MATIKSYTDIEQSRKLAKILPLESADMAYCAIHSIGHEPYHCNIPIFVYASNNDIPCWSLAALLSVFPYYEINNNGVNIQLSVKGEALITEKGEYLLDLAVNMIIRLNELNLL